MKRDGDDYAEYLRYLTYKGASERYPEYVPEDEWAAVEHMIDAGDPARILRDRLEHELDVIIKSGFPSYFLIVADLMRFCRESEIPVGPGRGSVAGSAIAYCLYITDVEPIRWGIPFERFMHLERIAMPDIDIDLCMNGRQAAIQYLRDTYGTDSVAQIAAFGTMQARGVVKDVARALHVDIKLGEKLAKMIPEGSGADQIILKDWLEEEESIEFRRLAGGLSVTFEGRDVSFLDTVLRLEGLRRHGSVHAAGVVIGNGPLIDLVPLYRRNQDSEVQIQYDFRDAEDIGLLKLDVLGLRNVTILGEAERLVQRRIPGFRIKDVPLDDDTTFQLLRDGDTVGVFQLEGEGITNAVMGVAPDRFDDIVATIALYRPGPMEQLATYIHRKHGEEPVQYDHPDMEPVLDRTYGLIVYQEQVMGLARVLAGYTPGEADLFRKAIGKKLPELIRTEIEKFTAKAVAKGYDKDLIERIGHQIAFFGRYGFNLGHATGYAFITYWTAYLKANHPTEFYTACLNSNIDSLDRIAVFVRDAAQSGIRVLPPDINQSARGFTVACIGDCSPSCNGEVRFGLEAIKGVGESVVVDILEERDSEEKNEYFREKEVRTKKDEQGTQYNATVKRTRRVANDPRPYDDFYDFCRRLTHVPINVKESLIKAGAFEADIEKRAILLACATEVNTAAKKGKQPSAELAFASPLGELEMLRMEREVMGFYVTKHPLDLHRAELQRHGATVDGSLEELPHYCCVAGIVTDIRLHQSKKGQMAWVKLETGIRDLPEITMFNDAWGSITIKKDDTIIVRGEKQHHAKFGWGIIATHVSKLDESRPTPKSILISMPDTEPSDILELDEMSSPEGSKIWILVQDYSGRLALVRTERYLRVTGKVVKDLEAKGYSIRYNYSPNDPAPLGKKTCTRAAEHHGGSGPKRKAVWELPIVRQVISTMGGKVVAEMKS